MLAQKAKQSPQASLQEILPGLATSINDRTLLYKKLLQEHPEIYYEQTTQDYWATQQSNLGAKGDQTATDSEKNVIGGEGTEKEIDYSKITTEDLSTASLDVISKKQVELELNKIKKEHNEEQVGNVLENKEVGNNVEKNIEKIADVQTDESVVRNEVITDLQDLQKTMDTTTSNSTNKNQQIANQDNSELIDSIKEKIARFNRKKKDGEFKPAVKQKTKMSESDVQNLIVSDEKNLAEIRRYMDETYGEEELKTPSFKLSFAEVNAEDATETMAKLYEKQGNLQKAINVYEQLSQKFPDKAAYFADRVDMLKKML